MNVWAFPPFLLILQSKHYKPHLVTIMKRTLTLFVLILAASIRVTAGVPLSYYSSVNGHKKGDLKAALHRTIQVQKVLSYGGGSASTWSGFYQTDRMSDGEVRDRYSNDHRYFASNASASSASAVSGMNIEHSFPKSWWGGTTNNAYKDLFNLMPCEASINSSKSNYAMGVVTNVMVDNGCTKVGKGTTTSGTTRNLWEPADNWKGDFARAYMYMATTYSDFTWTSNGLDMLEKNDWPTLQPWAYKLLCKWNREDPVDEIEIARNEAVYKIQGNRNPFVDFPHLAEYVWGDSTARAFDINTTFKAGGSDNGDGTVEPEHPTFNIDEDGNVLDISTLIAVCSGTSSSGGRETTFKFEDLLVTYANGRNIFVSDGERGFMFYGNNSAGLKAGDRIAGKVSGVDYFYYRLPELGFTALDDVQVISRDNDVKVPSVTIAELTGLQASEYYSMPVRLYDVQLEDSGFSNKRLNCVDAAGAEYLLFDTWQMFTNENYITAEGYDIVGIPIIYNSTYEMYPISILPSTSSAVWDNRIIMNPESETIYDMLGRHTIRRNGIVIRHGKKLIAQ